MGKIWLGQVIPRLKMDSDNKFLYPKTPIRLGVIGVGMVSQLAHLPAIGRTVGLKLVAIADMNESLAKQVAKRHVAECIHSVHTSLLDDPDINAVAIVIHRNGTAALVRDALQRGKHVFSEKPMAMTLTVAQELVALARRHERIYAVGFMKRYDAGVLRAQAILADLVSSPRLGRLIFVRGKNFCAEYVGYCEDYIRGEASIAVPAAPTFPVTPDWLRPELARKYDWFANVGLHSINLLRFLLGADLSVRHAEVAYDQAATVMFDATGVPITLDLGRSATGRWEESFEFFFERGRLELQLTSLMQRDRCAAVTLDENLGEAKTSYWGYDTTEPWSFTRQMQAFADAIAGKPEALLATGEDSLKDMQLLEDIFQFAQGIKHG
jgi:predicted dehydrogenase